MMKTNTLQSAKLMRVGHSPDPDDAFMFYALAKEKIPMRGFQVEHVIEDIETLNQWALGEGYTPRRSAAPLSRGECAVPSARGVAAKQPGCVDLHVTAVSCHAYAYLADRYLILRSGASVGDHYGPVLVAKSETTNHRPQTTDTPLTPTLSLPGRGQGEGRHPSTVDCGRIIGSRIAVPGKLTTAYLALQIYASCLSSPHVVSGDPKIDSRLQHSGMTRGKGKGGKGDSPLFEPVFVPFDRIFEAVESGQADLGLVIHEGQITFEEKGFEKVVDLGQWWHEQYGLPLPLGIDVIRRDLGKETIESFAKLFKESIQYALAHREEALEYALQFGRGIRRNLGDRFVGMYVNDYTVDLGKKGEEGLKLLYKLGYEKGILPEKVLLEFVG